MIQKRSAPLNFAGGIDTKTDPKQVVFGNFLELVNAVPIKGGLFQKRNGFGNLTVLPNADSTNLTTFNGNLTAIGTSLQAYSPGTNSWVTKGTLQPISLDVLPTVRSALNQTQCDSVIASNGLICTVYTEVNNGVSAYKYVIQNSETGQNIVNQTAIPVSSGVVTGSPRVFLLGGYFIIVFTNIITATSHLQYIAISINNPTSVSANADISSNYIPASTLSWDGVVVGNKLYIAYNTTSGGQQIAVTYLNTSFTVATATSFAGSIATIMSMCADITNPASPVIYAAFYDSAGSTGFAIAVDQNLHTLMTATQIITTVTVKNITCTAQNGVMTGAWEVAGTYSYDSAIATNHLNKRTVTLPMTVTTGTVGTLSTFSRGVGLASKAFLLNSTMYMLTAYDGKSTTQAAIQPTYFLIDISDNVISRFAYENGGGYLTLGLPQAQVIGSTVNIAYLFKDLIAAANKSQGAATVNGVYSQTGVNTVFLTFDSSTLSISEIGSNLNISGGFLWAYDGMIVNEQNFHLFPDSVEVSQISDPTPTGTLSNVTNPTVITSVSSVANITAGMTVTDTTNPTTIPANTTVVSVGTTTVTMSAAATAAHAGDSLKFVGAVSAQQYFYQVTYEWTDAQGNIFRSAPSIPVTVTPTAGHTSIRINIPTLRLTYKPNVKIVIYRWSTAQQIYYQITSLTAPLLNDPTVDSVTYQDIQSDAQILGNNILYTTGGVLEDVAGPASTATTLFDDRLWLIDAEDKNLLWYSKQVIEATPVEMSDLLTIYVAPSIGASGPTGDMECLFPMDDKICIFKKNAIFYINGTGPDNTGANSQYSQPIFITSSVGSDNQDSMVLTPIGILFQSDKGIWLLGRDLQTTYLGAPAEAFNEFRINSAQNIPGTTQVRFTLSNGKMVMYDYFFNKWGSFEGAPAISSTIYESLHTIINDAGVASQETPDLYLDNGNPVLMRFKTSWLNLTGLQGYQRAYFFYLLGEYITPHKLQLGIAYDYNDSFVTAPLITPDNSTILYGGIGPYGQGAYGGSTSVENWRVFLKKQRCQAFQISIQEVYDPTKGIAAGAGLTISGLNLIYGSKNVFRPIPAAKSVG